MIKKTLVVVSMVLAMVMEAVASPSSVTSIKDFKVNKISLKSLEVVIQGEKVVIEEVGSGQYKLNGQLVAVDSNDSFAGLQNKVEKAYKASKRKTGLLDQILIQEAHAMPGLIAALMGGMLGLGVGSMMCNNSSQQAPPPSSDYAQ